MLILLGGVLYTAGAIVYAKKGFRYHHLVWHLFIDLALLSHLAGIVFLSVDNEFAYMPGRNNADSFGGRDLGTVRNHKRGQYRE